MTQICLLPELTSNRRDQTLRLASLDYSLFTRTLIRWTSQILYTQL